MYKAMQAKMMSKENKLKNKVIMQTLKMDKNKSSPTTTSSLLPQKLSQFVYFIKHLPDKHERWFQNLTIHILFAEEIASRDDKPGERFYVKSRVRGQKLRIDQKTDAKPITTTDNNGTVGTIVSWYAPTTYKLCVQSMFQDSSIEFIVMRTTESVLLHQIQDHVVGVVSVPVKELHAHKTSDSMRFSIMAKEGSADVCKGYLYLSKPMIEGRSKPRVV